MICPLCKTDTLKENVSLRKGFLKLQKIFTYFCPMCDFRKEVIIKISKENYDTEVIQLSNIVKVSKQIYDTTNKKISNRYGK